MTSSKRVQNEYSVMLRFKAGKHKLLSLDGKDALSVSVHTKTQPFYNLETLLSFLFEVHVKVFNNS